MNNSRTQILVCFFITVSIIVTYQAIKKARIDAGIKEAQVALETEKFLLEQDFLKRQHELDIERLKVKQANLHRYNDLGFYGIACMIGAMGLSIIILAVGYSRAKIKQASVLMARIGQHSAIPIHYNDLQSFYPIAVNLSLAEIEASVSTAHDTAYRISRQMIEDITEYTRAIAGKRALLAGHGGKLAIEQLASAPQTATPTFAQLLNSRTLAPGKPLILGYGQQGQPQHRELRDLKSLAIAGWQGSGKTLSTGYIIASSVLAYGVHIYVVDPHKHHPESLSALIQPLESTGHVTVINPFDTPHLIYQLNRTLDRRLAGEEPSESGILLVIDEMARLAKMECFDTLITFLERCTEETRKANITFIGGSHKWTARHFKGRADIRGCMNSMLIHKTKPSQADLLLEDSHDKNLVKQLRRPGDAILVTDFDHAMVVALPFCRREDMETVAEIVRQTYPTTAAPVFSPIAETKTQHPDNTASAHIKEDTSDEQSEPFATLTIPTPEPAAKSEKRRALKDVIPFDLHRKRQQVARQIGVEPKQLTVEMIHEQIQQRKARGENLTQAELARQLGISPGLLSKILKNQRPLTAKYRLKFFDVFFGNAQKKLQSILR